MAIRTVSGLVSKRFPPNPARSERSAIVPTIRSVPRYSFRPGRGAYGNYRIQWSRQATRALGRWWLSTSAFSGGTSGSCAPQILRTGVRIPGSAARKLGRSIVLESVGAVAVNGARTFEQVSGSYEVLYSRRGLQFPPAAIRCAPGVGPQSISQSSVMLLWL